MILRNANILTLFLGGLDKKVHRIRKLNGDPTGAARGAGGSNADCGGATLREPVDAMIIAAEFHW